jgi:hypothetical protein
VPERAERKKKGKEEREREREIRKVKLFCSVYVVKGHRLPGMPYRCPPGVAVSKTAS